MQTKLRAIKDVSEVEVDLRSTEDGILGGVDIARIWTARGYGWSAMATAAVASLIVRPTTVAIVTFYNNTAKNFVIERLFAHNLVSIANGQFGIWYCMHPTGMTAPTNDITIRNSTIGSASGTEGIFDNGATVVDDGWFPIGASNYSVTATVPGSLAEAHVNGKLIVRPTAAISLSCVGQTAAVTVCMGLHYFSVPVSEFATG